MVSSRLPDACYLNADIEVQRIWKQELEKILNQSKTLDKAKAIMLAKRQLAEFVYDAVNLAGINILAGLPSVFAFRAS